MKDSTYYCYWCERHALVGGSAIECVDSGYLHVQCHQQIVELDLFNLRDPRHGECREVQVVPVEVFHSQIGGKRSD
jgi:hypothetical protein